MKDYYKILAVILLITLSSCHLYRKVRFDDTYIKGTVEITSREINKNLNEKVVLHGYVYSLVDSIPLKGANVWINETKIGVATDENGYFKIETEPRECIIKFSFVGHNEESSKEIILYSNEVILLTARLGTTIQ